MEFKFPDLGEGIAEGELVKWLVKPGDTVKEDQEVAEVETDKALVSIPSPTAGVVETLHYKEGDTVKVGSVLITFSEGGKKSEAKEEKPEPKVSIRSSVKPEYISCLECGKKQKMLKRHLMTNHEMTPADYRQKWSLASDYPMVAPNYAAQRSEFAKKIGLGRSSGRQTRRRAS